MGLRLPWNEMAICWRMNTLCSRSDILVLNVDFEVWLSRFHEGVSVFCFRSNVLIVHVLVLHVEFETLLSSYEFVVHRKSSNRYQPAHYGNKMGQVIVDVDGWNCDMVKFQ